MPGTLAGQDGEGDGDRRRLFRWRRRRGKTEPQRGPGSDAGMDGWMENVSEGWGRTAWGRDVDEELGEPPARRPAWATQSVGSGPTTRVLPQLSRVPYTTTRGSHQPQAQGARGTSPPAQTEGARQCPRRGAVRRGASHQHGPVGLQPWTHACAFPGAVCHPRQPRATHTPAPAQAHAARAPWGHPERVEMLTHAPAPAKPPPGTPCSTSRPAVRSRTAPHVPC